MKHFCIFFFIFFAYFTYSQEINFQKNESYTARKFKFIQKLNNSGDSLILESEKILIKRVDILNEQYLEIIDVDAKKAKINLKDLPLGSYVLQAKLGTHWIVMYLEKTDIIEDIEADLNVAELKNEQDLNRDAITKNANEFHLDKENMYWVVYESNAPFSSKKTMGFKFDDEIYDLIYKVELEVNSETGKNNMLLVYEIYDRKKFIQKQLKNLKYYKEKQSEFFNVLPIYTSEKVK